MDKKHSLNIGISSMACWLFLDGDMSKPIRAFADANCDVCIGEGKQRKGGGEEWNNMIRVEYNEKHIVKLRDGWVGFTDEKYYGKIICRQGNSPFLE